MGFGTPTVELEGDYSTWTEKWISPTLTVMSVVGDGLCFGAIDVNGKKVYLRDSEAGTAILNLDDGVVISDDDLARFGTKIYWLDMAHSIKSKYVVIFESWTSFRIYKDGLLKQTVTIPGATLSGFLISSDGKYIIAHRDDTHKVHCYEGS